jgi:hypothetical protein
MAQSETDCRTPEGIEVALIDAFITIARTLRGKGIERHPATIEALKDLSADEDVQWLLEQANNVFFL